MLIIRPGKNTLKILNFIITTLNIMANKRIAMVNAKKTRRN